jgi:hypothetical protein
MVIIPAPILKVRPRFREEARWPIKMDLTVHPLEDRHLFELGHGALIAVKS